jgi:hypothetical protein
MTPVNFICPQCGCQPVYSLELAKRILAVVCMYFELDEDDVCTKWLHYGPEGRARAFTLRYIRRMTGEHFKICGEIFNLSGARAGSMVKLLEQYIAEKPLVKKQAKEIEALFASLQEKCNFLTHLTSKNAK